MKKFTIQNAMSKAIAIMIAIVLACGAACAVLVDTNSLIYFAVVGEVAVMAIGVCCAVFALATHAIDMENASENLPIENFCYRATTFLGFGFGAAMLLMGMSLFVYSIFDITFWPTIIGGSISAVITLMLSVATIPLHIAKNRLVNKAENAELE